MSRKRRSNTDPEHDYWARRIKPLQVDELERVSRDVLSGRNATVWESLVLDPLRGKAKRTPEELAEQFRVSAARIYRIKNRANDKVRRGLQSASRTRPVKPTMPPIMLDFMDGGGERCAVCNHGFRWTSAALCNGIFGDGRPRSECLRTRWRMKELLLATAAYDEARMAWLKETSGVDLWAKIRPPDDDEK